MAILSEYEVQLRLLRQLKAGGADKSTLRKEAQKLKELKRRYSNKKRKRQADRQADRESTPAQFAEVYTYFYSPIPADEEGFTQAFSVPGEGATEQQISAILDFFTEKGFIVFRDVLSTNVCADTIGEIWHYLEDVFVGFDHSEPETYHHLSSQTYGLAPVPSIFTEQIVKNRCNPNVIRAFQTVLRDQNILLSHDRWCAYRPTKSIQIGTEIVDKPNWKTKENLHVDLNPWTYFSSEPLIEDLKYDKPRDFSKEINAVYHKGGPNVQGVLALNNNSAHDGGTVLLTGFHRCFQDWQRSLGEISRHMPSRSEELGHLVWRGKGTGSYILGQKDVLHKFKQKINMRAGSLLIWDQRIVHGSVQNDSNNFRLAQFVKAFRRKNFSQARLHHRAKRVNEELAKLACVADLSDASRAALGMTLDF
jgi:hypothetical protein